MVGSEVSVRPSRHFRTAAVTTVAVAELIDSLLLCLGEVAGDVCRGDTGTNGIGSEAMIRSIALVDADDAPLRAVWVDEYVSPIDPPADLPVAGRALAGQPL